MSTCSHKIEDKAVDLYVLKRALISLHPGSEKLFEILLGKYQNYYSSTEDLRKQGVQIVEKYWEVELWGRKKVCFG